MMRQNVLRWLDMELMGDDLPVDVYGPFDLEVGMQVANLEQRVLGAWGPPWSDFFLTEVAEPWARAAAFFAGNGIRVLQLDSAASISPGDWAVLLGQAGFSAAAGVPMLAPGSASALVGALADHWFAV
jgi:hypothetical protein